jgi:hypothetical protein
LAADENEQAHQLFKSTQDLVNDLHTFKESASDEEDIVHIEPDATRLDHHAVCVFAIRTNHSLARPSFIILI